MAQCRICSLTEGEQTKSERPSRRHPASGPSGGYNKEEERNTISRTKGAQTSITIPHSLLIGRGFPDSLRGHLMYYMRRLALSGMHAVDGVYRLSPKTCQQRVRVQ
jgi:hypothetical protein